MAVIFLFGGIRTHNKNAITIGITGFAYFVVNFIAIFAVSLAPSASYYAMILAECEPAIFTYNIPQKCVTKMDQQALPDIRISGNPDRAFQGYFTPMTPLRKVRGVACGNRFARSKILAPYRTIRYAEIGQP